VPDGASQRGKRVRSVQPAFVVSLARSGSTLLRFLLDSHPEMTAPPELNLSALLQYTTDSWNNVEVARGNALPNEVQLGGVPVNANVRRHARKAVDQVMLACARDANASLYCDKSLSTVDHLRTVGACYPDAPLIFLYRYPLDLIASGLEASRWGFNAFGFLPYVSSNPGNFIGALAQYWIDRVGRMVEFERSYEGPTGRIYYELLCDQPKRTLEQLFDFLDRAYDEELIDDVIRRAFDNQHGQGPGDYKIEFTGGISVESIGRGATLPEHLTPQQTERMNELLAELDYPDLGAARRGQLGALLGLEHARDVVADGREIAEAMVEALGGDEPRTISERLRAALPFQIVVARAARGEPAQVIVDADGRARVAAAAEDGDGIARVRCIGDVVSRVAAGEVSFGKAVHDGEIRVERDTAPEGGAPPHEVLAALAMLLRADG
jgi:hypothetical protein